MRLVPDWWPSQLLLIKQDLARADAGATAADLMLISFQQPSVTLEPLLQVKWTIRPNSKRDFCSERLFKLHAMILVCLEQSS